jgi:hypothetical protein
MVRSKKATGKAAVAAVATAFLTSALVSARSSQAGPLAAQDVRKVEGKVEAKIEAKAEEKAVDKVEITKEAAAVAPMLKLRRATKVAVPVQGQVQADDGEGNAALQPMYLQLVQQYRPLLRSELRILTSSAEPSPAQRREIAMEGGKALKSAAMKMAAIQQGINAVRGVNAYPDPRELIHNAIEEVVKQKLSPEQVERYKKEMEAKSRDQRLAVMQNVVANLDKIMFLSSEQRDKLCEVLLANWNEQTYPTIDSVTVYENYFPIIPNQTLSPILGEDQMKIWRTAPKIQFGSIRNSNLFNQLNLAGDDPEDEDVNAALAEEAKKK